MPFRVYHLLFPDEINGDWNYKLLVPVSYAPLADEDIEQLIWEAEQDIEEQGETVSYTPRLVLNVLCENHEGWKYEEDNERIIRVK